MVGTHWKGISTARGRKQTLSGRADSRRNICVGSSGCGGQRVERIANLETGLSFQLLSANLHKKDIQHDVRDLPAPGRNCKQWRPHRLHDVSELRRTLVYSLMTPSFWPSRTDGARTR